MKYETLPDQRFRLFSVYAYQCPHLPDTCTPAGYGLYKAVDTRKKGQGMALLSTSAAARVAGVSRTTIYDKIESGELTRNASKQIDTTELIRVFGELKGAGTESDDTGKSDAVVNDAHTIWLQELVDKQQATIERQAKELQQAHEQAEHNRQEWTEQVMKLTTALLPAPEQSPEPKRGLLARLFS